MNIEVLPDKVLEHILRHLDWYDRRSSMLVSRRWNTVAFEACDSIVLKVFTSEVAIQKWEKYYGDTTPSLQYNFDEMIVALVTRRRRYKSIVLVWATHIEQSDNILYILRSMSPTVESLKMYSCECVTDLNWLTRVLKLFPNLRHLDINDVWVADEFPNGSFKFIEINAMNNLHTLLDKRQVVAFVRNAPDKFPNITTAYIRLTRNSSVKRMLHIISPSLIHLSVNVSPALFREYHMEQFPLLETFDLYYLARTSIEPLSQFVLNAPQLKNLKVLTRVDVSVLRDLHPFYKTLKKLAINVGTLNLNLLQMVENFTNLERLWLCVLDTVDLKPSDNSLPVLTNVRTLILNNFFIVPICDEFYRVCFPNLIELYLQNVEPNLDCLQIVNQLPSLRVLIIHNLFCQADLTQFVQFCREVPVQELHMYCTRIDMGHWNYLDSLEREVDLQKLTINAKRIDPGVYEPLLRSLPGLKSLQLGLDDTCDNEIVKTLYQQFPRCHVKRVLRPKTHFEREIW